MSKFDAIFCIVNEGYSEQAMETAKQLGARGGTVISARGTASKDAEKIFNISIQPEKEIVMIIVPSKIKDSILRGLYNVVGSGSLAQGIAFALPVDDVVGIQLPNEKVKKEN